MNPPHNEQNLHSPKTMKTILQAEDFDVSLHFGSQAMKIPDAKAAAVDEERN